MAWHPFRHFGLKVAALALGTLLWLTVSGHQIERRVPVPVSYSNVPAPFEMTGDQMDDASVHVRGGDNVVSALGQGDLRIIVDLAEAHTGENVIALRTDQVVAPLGIEVIQIDPAEVVVTLEKSGQRSIEVQPTVEGRPADGYQAGQALVEPKMVVVVGPESRLNNPISVVAERVVVEGRTSTIVQEVGVAVLDAQLRVSEPRTVRVTVPITSERSPR